MKRKEQQELSYYGLYLLRYLLEQHSRKAKDLGFIYQRELAKEIGMSYSAFNEMLNGKRSLSPELAMMMDAALGVDAAPLLAMLNEYDMQMAERDDSFMEKLKQIRRILCKQSDLGRAAAIF